jgi:hypothetical protein
MRRLPLAVLLVFPLAAHADDLALKRVMLSTGGVGYFEFAADVDGPTSLGLDIKLDQADDVLASLVVFDSAGSVGGVDLPGHDGARAAFGALPFGPAALASALDYLNALQGVEFSVTGPRPMTGKLLRAETVSEAGPAPDRIIKRTRVTLLTAAGLQQFVLEDADGVQVADPALRSAIDHALATARAESAQTARHLRLHGGGSGHRTVRVGYVAGAPLWKTTYRLVLPTGDGAIGDGATARLQGWAVLENDSAADWQDVDLTLQYGNPVTFRQALYRSYYLQRPEVPVEVLGRILPGVDAGTVAVSAARAAAAPAPAAPAAPAPGATMMMKSADMPAPMAAPQEPAGSTEAAQATLFHLAAPLSLPAGHSATVPILDREVPAERIGVVQQGRPHPLQALQLRNDTGTSLPAGMLTLYDTGNQASFAGDARLGGLPVGETRLLEFAEDLRTNVDWRSEANVTVIGVTAAQGVLTVQQRDRATFRITLTAPAAQARRLVLELPRRTDGTLAVEGDLKPSGETATAWRLPLTLQPGETRTVVAHDDRVVREETALLEDADGVLAEVLGTQALSPSARAGLQHVADLRATLSQREQARDRWHGQRDEVERDEDRLRKNLASVAAGDALHGKLARALDADEERIASLTASIATAEAAASQARAALEQAVRSLSI